MTIFSTYYSIIINKNFFYFRKAVLINNYIKQFIPLIDVLAGTFGKNCEVVLHDLSKPEKSIIKIANGHVTGRKVESPITDLGLSLLKKFKKNGLKNNSFVSYRTKTKKGTELKSTTFFIKNDKGKVVGALCINIDITPYIFVKKVLEELYQTNPINFGDEDKESPEKFESSVDTLINELIKQTVKKFGKPIVHMGKKEKLQIVHDLKEKGLFLIKGSARRVSKELNVSLATIYKYLEEVET